MKERREKHQEREENIREDQRNLGKERRGGQRHRCVRLSLSVSRPGSVSGAEGVSPDPTSATGGAAEPERGAAVCLRRQKVRAHPPHLREAR